MQQTKLSTLLAILALSAPMAAFAAGESGEAAGGQPPAGEQPQEGTAPEGAEGRAASPLFMQLDANKDGHVDEGEAGKSATVKGNFKQMDSDGDGKISTTEWTNFESAGGGSSEQPK
jgi:hypothetical protein